MKIKFVWLWAMVVCIGFTACSKDDSPFIEIPSESAMVKFNEGDLTQTITFEANQSWTASVQETKSSEVSWLSVSPQTGGPGMITLTITANDNYSQSERTACIHIQVDGLSKSIAVTQTPGIPVLSDDQANALVASNGFFVVNEDWFGWDNGTVNYFKLANGSYEPTYRAYRAANSGEQFGVTTQFATIWGDNAYFCSKQGTRFVVADAKTLKKKAAFETIGGDGRAFVGVDDKKGYISLSNGIVVFDITNLQLGSKIEGVSSQIGSMCTAGGRVFAVSQSNGLYVINAKTNVLEQTIAGTYYTLTQSKDGDVWAASSTSLVRINPETLESETIAYPAGTNIGSSWGAWSAGTLCASTKNNAIYWAKGTSVIKYDIDTKTVNANIYTLGKSEYNTQLSFYGAGLRVDPLTDELILTVKHSGWGASGAYNWIYKLDANGQEITNFKVKGDNGSAAGWGGNAEDWDGKYFWFPAMPFFEDANKPQILTNQIVLTKGEEKNIDLDKMIVDYDNSFASIQKTVQFTDNNAVIGNVNGSKLVIKAGSNPGKSICTIVVISNGVRVEKAVRIDITE